MCLFTSARTVAIVFARSAGSEAMYCAGVLTFDGGFMDSSSFPNEVYHRTFENQPRQAEFLQGYSRFNYQNEGRRTYRRISMSSTHALATPAPKDNINPGTSQ